MSTGRLSFSAAKPPKASGVTLACPRCSEQEVFQLDGGQLAELNARQEIKMVCPTCQSITAWSEVYEVAAPLRLSRVQVELPLRIQCNELGSSIDEITHTVHASRKGATFHISQTVKEGALVKVQMPYTKGDNVPATRARVTEVYDLGDAHEVTVEFLRR